MPDTPNDSTDTTELAVQDHDSDSEQPPTKKWLLEDCSVDGCHYMAWDATTGKCYSHFKGFIPG